MRVTLPADLTGWNFPNVLQYALNMAVLVVGSSCLPEVVRARPALTCGGNR